MSTLDLDDLHRRYWTSILRFVRSRLPDRDWPACEDIAAEAFYRAVRAAPNFTPQSEAHTRSWLFTIAHNLIRDRARSWAVCPEAVPLEETWHADDGQAFEEAVETASAVLAAVDTALTDRQREVVTLRFLQGCSTAETAAALGFPTVDAVKKIQARALVNLRAELARAS